MVFPSDERRRRRHATRQPATVRFDDKLRSEGCALAVMHQVAERKFGTETADRLAEWLKKLRREDVTNPEPTRVVGEWLFECESGETLLDRVEGLCEPSAPGDGAATD